MNDAVRALSLSVSPRVGSVDAVLVRPEGALALLVLGHGAGAGMRHHFLEGAAQALALEGVATLRYEFPYMQRGSKRPDVAAVLQATARAAVNAAGLLAEGLPLFAGGKSMGGRMTSMAQADRPLHGVQGLVFLGFPLHPAGAPATARGDHLATTHLPLLFLQGTRDRLADLALLRPVVAALGARASLVLLDGGDHDFRVGYRDGPRQDEVLAWLARQVAGWIGGVATR
ncbi:MAG TPA: alpha/beta family hydrolase [Gemmatimonadales bacterium]